MIGRGRGAASGGTGVVENAALVGQAHHVVVDDPAVQWRHAGEDAFVKGAGERRQLAVELVEHGAAGRAAGLQMAQGIAGHLIVKAVEYHQNDL
ncbi:hypothetical protein D3C77_598690 [compost metagenome]